MPQFTSILGQITGNDKAWKTWFDSEAPEDAAIPDGYHGSLDTFRKLLLIRSWCPDRTMNQARRYITESIGKEVTLTQCKLHLVCKNLLYMFRYLSIFRNKALFSCTLNESFHII